jgi:hypothetical protein
MPMTITLQAPPRANGPIRGSGHSFPLAALLAWSCTAGWLTPAGAQMYRYVDENGVTVYSQVPPRSVDATEIQPDPGPSAAARNAALQRLRRQLESDFDRRSEAKRQAEQQAEEAARAEVRANNCHAARTNLDTLQNLGARHLELPDGRVVTPGEQQRQRLIEDARAQVRENCD